MKNFKRFLGLALAVVFAVVATPVDVSAKEIVQIMGVTECNDDKFSNAEYEGVNNFESSPLARSNKIIAAGLAVTPRTNEILITFGTTSNFIAKTIGVRNIYVQEKVWYGWKTIAHATGSTDNSGIYSGQCRCTNATNGKTYRVLCTHFAIESNGTEHIVENKSETFVYN